MDVSDAPVAGIGHNRPTIAELFRDQHKDLIAAVEDLMARANKAKGKIAKTGIRTDAQRDEWIALGKEARALDKRVEDARAAEVDPLNAQVKEWNGLFGTQTPKEGTLRTRCLTLLSAATNAVDGYNRAQQQQAREAAAAAAEKERQAAQAMLDKASNETNTVKAEMITEEAQRKEERARALEHQALNTTATTTRSAAGLAVGTKFWNFRVTDWTKIDLNELRQQFSVEDIEKAIRSHVKKHDNTMPLKGVEIYQDTRTTLR